MKLIFLTCFVFSLTAQAIAKTVVLDVRTPKEYSERHLAPAINIDVQDSNFKTEINKLNHDDLYQVYCGTGRRASMATTIMKELGFKYVENLNGIEDAAKHLNLPLPPIKK